MHVISSIVYYTLHCVLLLALTFVGIALVLRSEQPTFWGLSKEHF